MNGNFIKNLFVWFIIFASLMGAYQILSEGKRTSNEIQYSEFLKRVNNGEVIDVEIRGNQINGEYIGMTGETSSFKTYGPVGDDLLNKMTERKVNFTFLSTEESGFFAFLINWAPMIILILLMVFFIKQLQAGGRGAMSFGKSRAKMISKEDNKKTFDDVAGVDEAKEEVQEIVEFLRNPKKFTSLGGRIPKGILLVGSPGTGKTLLAKAIAGEAGVPFFIISGSDFVEMFVGVGASRVRDLFAQAKKNSPCIIFVDELDAVGRHRGAGLGGGHDEREQTLNQLLVEMDGFGTNHHVIVVAATNRADILDRALTRAGRFDRQIYIDLPEIEERKDIFKVHTKKIKIDKKIDLDFLAKQTPGFSGADIANICNEAALNAAKNNKKKIEREDFLEAIDRIVGGLEKKNKLVSKEERETVAYHEAGHATVSWMLEHAAPLIKVTIVPRGRSLGAAWYLPEERQLTTKEQIFDEMCVAMGGRAAEELIFKKVTTGALSDLEKITKQARAMIAFFGLNDKIGNVTYYDSSGQDSPFTKPYSEYTAKLIDEEIKKITNEAYNKAKKILTKHKKSLIKLSELLLEKEVIFKKDVENILGKRKWKEVERIRVNKIKKK